MVWRSSAVVHQSYKSPIQLKEFEIGELKPNQILVKTAYASINPVDVKLHALTFTSSEKHTLKDFSGEVVAKGANVRSNVNVGDKVWGSILNVNNDRYVGSYTLADFEKDIVAPLPVSLSLEQGAAIGVVYGTAFEMLEKAQSSQKLGPESTILVMGGATAVGVFIAQIAKKYLGVGKVVVTCSPNSAEYAKGYGADDYISYRSQDVRGEYVRYVKEKNGGKRFDAILDAVGGYDAIAVFPQILKPGSEGSAYVTIMGDSSPAQSYAGTMVKALLSLPWALFRTAFGKWYGINYYIFLVEKGRYIDLAPEFFGTPGVKVPIDSVYPIRDVKEAWAKVDSTRARGKVIVKF